MNILVTGATGFIGRYLVAQLTARQHQVIALMRRPEGIDDFRRQIEGLGGNGLSLSALQGDLDQPDLALEHAPESLDAVVHLGARFAWKLPTEAARQTNVEGALAVARLAHKAGARLVMISGFMLENAAHLQSLGIDPEHPETVDWPAVYRQTGAYEASKLEGALRVRQWADSMGLDWIEVQPATVSGHSQTGALESAQPLYQLMDNLAHGRLTMIPGTSAHQLPLVPVDLLAGLIVAACEAQTVPRRLLALDAETPNLDGVIGQLANGLGRKPPRRHMPIRVLQGLLRIPGVSALMKTAPESLQFIQTRTFSSDQTREFARSNGVEWPSIMQSLRQTAQAYRHL
ncbi:MAG: NAD-dependent dehydratase [Alteromonadaceae bacterium]|nr:NAD-dependent dehydratase [Alteromonadaceae bacterium]MBH85045.1 NAD-dependent dehydratase [Alteromonadaceae bacterium]|tara:strand:- start:61724 stop:62758 length:1035 start_codon:yes stop_codon:yes gene_type:complete